MYFYYHPESSSAWSNIEKEAPVEGLVEEIEENFFNKLISEGMVEVTDTRVASKRKTLVFLDTETTDKKEGSNIIQLAFLKIEANNKNEITKRSFSVSNEFYKNVEPISFDAMQIHHITEEMIADKPILSDSSAQILELNRLNDDNTILIIHNAKFDTGMLSPYGFTPSSGLNVVDTLRVAKHLLPESGGFSLGRLYYEHGLYKNMPAIAKRFQVDVSLLNSHDAVYDNLMLSLLYKMLLSIAKSSSEMIRLSSTPAMISKFHFGKYQGESIRGIAEVDESYLRWLLNNYEGLDDDLTYTIKHHLGE